MAEYPGYTQQYAQYRQLVEGALERCLPQEHCPQQQVEDAMRYSLLGGGKRLRGVLVLALNQLCGGEPTRALPFACAIEMVHAYSLIHDDLPCMDNDELRRGKPTCHVQYGEAIALLAGDGLLTKAFELVTDPTLPLSAQWRCQAAAILARAAGSRGMIGGQVIDIENEGKSIPSPLLDTLHSLKTGALIRCAAALGCLSAQAEDALLATADRYAALLGLIFQIVDDLLDVTSTAQVLGKSIGKDAQTGKTTYATLYGLEKSQRIVADLVRQAKETLGAPEEQSRFLRDLTEQMAVRTK